MPRPTDHRVTHRRTIVGLEDHVVGAMRSRLPEFADRTVETIIDEVPSYANALSGPMGRTIRTAVHVTLDGFLTLATREDAGSRMAPAVERAYELGRGEARSGRSMEALLAAYRIGARASWGDLSQAAVAAGVDAGQLSRFAALVFAFIDELSAASAAGHSDELGRNGRERERSLEQLARALVSGASAEAVTLAAERAEWEPPPMLTAVLVSAPQASPLLSLLDPRTLLLTEDSSGPSNGLSLLLVPSAGSPSARAALLAYLRDTAAVVGPSLHWLDVASSYRRARCCVDLGLDGLIDSDAHLAGILLAADPTARADLRAQILAPLAQLRPSSADKLAETLRSWLLHQGRREAVAEELFLHPQTVRYRMGQLRALYPDRLEDPRFVVEAILALA